VKSAFWGSLVRVEREKERALNPALPHQVTSRDKLIDEYTPLVKAVAWDYASAIRRHRIDYEDVIGAGTLGLVQAADRWTKLGRPIDDFERYARLCIYFEVRRALSDPATTNHHRWHQVPDRTPALPQFVPLFGCRSFTPQSPCPHSDPMPYRCTSVCMVNHESGWDDHPLLQLRPTDPKPARQYTPPPKPEIRRLRRAHRFGRPWHSTRRPPA
jgi:hypothetical protein